VNSRETLGSWDTFPMPGRGPATTGAHPLGNNKRGGVTTHLHGKNLGNSENIKSNKIWSNLPESQFA